ncbi:hypothetical protein FOL47_000047 [Perkinsus chesapeaki]|uniref:Uncharacterized protein n=1 Tax=Perkinsus chesapeaki TaxID=330153 RepID=A0A7J6N322_PERCH|nr:hypothetical protein FOL47_000047 [Perkinsus chesapeaki]
MAHTGDLPTEGIYIWRGDNIPGTDEPEMIRFGLFYPHPHDKGPEGLSTLDLQSSTFVDKPHLGGIKWNYFPKAEKNIELDYTNAVFSSMEQKVPIWGQAFFDRYEVDKEECSRVSYDRFYFGYEHEEPQPGDEWLIRFGLFNPHPEHPTTVGLAEVDFRDIFILDRPHVGGIVWTYHKKPYEHLHLDFTNAVFFSRDQFVSIWGRALFDRFPSNVSLQDWTDIPYSKAREKMVVIVSGKQYTLWLHKRPSATAETEITITE